MTNYQKDVSNLFWFIFIACILISKSSFSNLKSVHVSIDVSTNTQEINEKTQNQIWLSYVKLADGGWINFTFKNSENEDLPITYLTAKGYSKELVQYFVNKGVESKNALIKYSPTASVVVHKESGNNINANFIKLDPSKVQSFQVDNSTGGSYLTVKGNKIVFQPLSFKCPVDAIVDLNLHEIITKRDFVQTGFTSTSNKRNLTSNGMYQINATFQGKEVKLRKGAKVHIAFSKNNFDEIENKNSYHSFYGKQDKGIVNWTPSYHEKVSSTTDRANSESSVTPFVNNSPSFRVKREVSYTETKYVRLCQKIHLIDASWAKSLTNCKANEKTFNAIVGKHGKLNYIEKGKFKEINTYKQYVKRTKSNSASILIALNAEQNKTFTKKQDAENQVKDVQIAKERKEQEAIQAEYDANYKEELANYEARKKEREERDRLEKLRFPVQMRISKLGQINCDKFDNNILKTNVIVQLNDFDYDEIRVYAIFKNIKSVIHGYYRKEHKGEIKFDGLPEGKDVTYIAATFKGEDIKLAYTSSKIVSNDVLALELQTYSKEQYNRILDDLIPN